MIALTREYITSQDYLEFEREAFYYHEYFDGRICAMSDRMPWQSILANVTETLVSQLRGLCSIYTSEHCLGGKPVPKPVGINEKLPRSNNGLMIESLPTLANPAVIVEIMPPDIDDSSVENKFDLCRMSDALQDYVRVSQDRPLVVHLRREPNGEWIQKTYYDPGNKLRIGSIPCILKLAYIYDDVTFSTL